MRFSEQLRQEADMIYEEIFAHPFIQGIARGEVPEEVLIHYVKQDYEYLNAFLKVYGIAISKCRNREDMAMFNDQIALVLHGENHPHQNLCEYAGVNYEDLQGYPAAPTVNHYINHMLRVAYQGTLGEIIAVLLPCIWTYWEMGEKLVQKVQPSRRHPFYEWISFYQGEAFASMTHQFCERLDEWTQHAGEREKQDIMDAFLTSCRLEWAFWEMAYTNESWKTEKTVQ